jgi:Fe-only nitrogenase accessory protein AnfO
MQRIIAIIVDENGQITETQNAKNIFVFCKMDQKWSIQKEVQAQNIMVGNMADVRNRLEAIIKELADCKIIFGKSITGLAFNVFNQAGFIISELEEFDEKMLDFLFEDVVDEYESALAEKEAIKVPTAPTETETKGNYFFDFGSLKNSGSSLSSKEVLRPFLNETPFIQLEIICDHVMPWLESELKNRELTYAITEISSNKYSIVIKQ